MLFHVSEEPGIERFDPRPSPTVEGAVVWAVNGERLRNYLLPRECPRVTYFAGPSATAADIERLLGSSPAVVAVEAAWLDRIRSTRLFVYSMPEETFECVDQCAGYFQSIKSVTPTKVEIVEDPLAAIIATGAEIRPVLSLWPLHDAIPVSTLSYSIIRMRNAAARTSGYDR